MAQIKNNQVKFPTFNTRTTTPQMRGTVDMQSAMRGVPGGTPFNMSYNPGPMSKIPAPKAPLLPGTNNYTPMSIQALNSSRPQQTQQTGSPSFPQGGQMPSSNSTQSQLDSISSQAQGVQDLLNKRKLAESESSNKRTLKESSDTTFRGILDTLLGKSNPSKEQERARREMERIAAGNQAIGDNAAAISKQYSDEIARIGGIGAGQMGQLGRGTTNVAYGNAMTAQNMASARMQSLADAQSAALKGTEQQLTAQEQQANAFNPSLQASLTQQQLGLSGVGTAAGLAAPSVAPYGQTSFNPLTPGFAGGNMNPETQASSIAQQLMNGQMTYDQAVEAMQYAGTAGTNFLNQALSSMGANPLQLQAQGTAAQSNLQTTGTAQTQIAREGLGNATQNYVDMTSRSQVAHDQANRVMGILNKTGLNNVSSTDYNKALNSIKGRFSDTDLASLQTAMTEAQIAYMNLLQVGGGTPSGQEMAAISTLDITKSAGAINASIRELEAAVANKLQAQYGVMQQYQNNLPNSGGGSTGGYGGGTGGGTGWGDILD